MAYKGLENSTDFAAELALLADENGRDLMLVLVKATFDIADDGSLSISDEQLPICFEGEYFGEPGKSSLKVAPEANFDKLATDVALIGHAHAPNGQAVTQVDVSIEVGNMRQHIRVFGDRYWKKRKVLGITRWVMTKPEPAVKIPLIYENAFGGQDLTPEDHKHYTFESCNLLGKGIIAKKSLKEYEPLPNLEDPQQLIKSPADRPQPLGMGFISPDWEPRKSFAGTYDANWEKTRLPLLPTDFKREFFNSAHPKLKAPGYINGSEMVHIINACPQGRINFQLPGQKPEIKFKFQYEDPKILEVNLDTVLIDTDEMKLTMLWRATTDVFNRIYGMEKIIIDPYYEKTQEIPAIQNAYY